MFKNTSAIHQTYFKNTSKILTNKLLKIHQNTTTNTYNNISNNNTFTIHQKYINTYLKHTSKIHQTYFQKYITIHEQRPKLSAMGDFLNGF